MPSSYTPILRLTLPADGELVGTWGQTVNQGITALVESAIAGVASIALPDTDYTLTTVTGAADQARNAVIALTGTLTATRNVICPTATKGYVVQNGTNQSIVFKTAAGTGVTIPAGQAMPVRCNGTNVVISFTSLVDLTLTGTLSVTTLATTNFSYTGTLTGGTGVVNLGSGQFYKDAAGNVGIGTAGPLVPLDVFRSGTQVNAAVRASAGQAALLNIVGNANAIGATSFDLAQDGASAAVIINRANAALGIGTSNTIHATLDAAGNLGLGTAVTSSWRYSVVFSGTSVNGVTIEDSSAAGSPTLFRVVKNGVTRFSVDGSGSVSLPGALTVGSIAGVGTSLTALNASNLTTGTVPAARITAVNSGATVDGIELGYRGIPNVSTTGTTAATSERGKMYVTTGGITLPNATFSAGDTFSIYNNSASAITITQGASLTLRQAGTTNTGNRTLAARGICTVTFVSGSEAIISGAGLS